MTIDLTQPVQVSPPRRGTGDERPKMTRDQQLRARGFEIATRPDKGEPKWRLGKTGEPIEQSKIIGA